MKRLTELAALVDSLGVPWANTMFHDGEEPAPPFICLVAGVTETRYADNAAYLRYMPYDVALYAKARDYRLEKDIEAALDGAGFAYEKAVARIDAEDLIETAYGVAVEED